MIEKYPNEYSLQDEFGYTDKDLVTKLNEVIDVVNSLVSANEDSSCDCRHNRKQMNLRKE